MEAIQSIAPALTTPAPTTTSSANQAGSSFGDILKNMVAETNQAQQVSDQAMQQLHSGGEKNLHGAMISMEKADISMRYMIQVRNKAIDAYQEIMRMQV